MADADALSVDALCGFGAKNFISCTEFTHCGFVVDSSSALFIGHFGTFSMTASSVMVRHGSEWFMSGRLEAGAARYFVVMRVAFAGMLPSCRLARRLSVWALS
ncbi:MULTISPECIES: hypothetical protein [Pseudomonas]|uniref:hypothetical protein n=1 Tax=Pseudomonas TaxID=286 RepID=UPI0011B05D09|nr:MULTISPECIES: hypothetical protein [Pseudomonas]WLG49687.1 hypothetical protein PSH64_23660 [Pseudomonas sp. FP1742]